MLNNRAKKKILSPNEKLGELIKACLKCGADSDGKITKTKLAKLVYLSDFAFFYDNFKPITGVVYQKLERGPVSLSYFDQLDLLKIKNQINATKRGEAIMYFAGSNFTQPKLSRKELDMVSKVCDKWRNKNTEEIVKFTHDQIPWKVSFQDKEIPYSLIIQQDATSIY